MGRKSRTRNTNEPWVVGARGEVQNHTHPQPSLGAPTAEANTNNAPTLNAEVTPTPTPGESLTKNKFCKGIKHGRKYICSNETNDPETINKATELLTEATNRILKWRAWDPWWVEEVMDEWLITRDRLEVQLRGKYGEEVINDILRLVDRFVEYSEALWKYWHETGNDVEKLIEDLMSGKAVVIIRGEGGVSVHEERIMLKVDKTSTGITVQLKLNDLEGVTIKVPDVFRRTMSEEEYERFINDVLKALRGGLEETDGFVDRSKVAMDTMQVWQAVVWALLYPGRARVRISAINVNDGDVTIAWRLRTSRESLKGKILNIADKLSDEGLLAFMFTAILGDGCVRIAKDGRGNDEAVIKIAISDEEFEGWEPLLWRLWDRFRWHKYPGNAVDNVVFYSGYAIDLARAMISVLPPILKDILDALSFEKWLNIKRISEMEVKWRRGEMQIEVAGYKFTVDVQQDDTVVLEHRAKDDTEVDGVISALRARYGDGFAVNIRKSGRYRVVAIPMYIFERYDDIKERVIQVLCKKLEKTKDERRRVITKHLRRLAPIKGAAAAQLTKTLKNTKHIPK